MPVGERLTAAELFGHKAFLQLEINASQYIMLSGCIRVALKSKQNKSDSLVSVVRRWIRTNVQHVWCKKSTIWHWSNVVCLVEWTHFYKSVCHSTSPSVMYWENTKAPTVRKVNIDIMLVWHIVAELVLPLPDLLLQIVRFLVHSFVAMQQPPARSNPLNTQTQHCTG